MRKKIEKLMYSERPGVFLSILSHLYGLGAGLRSFLYRAGVLKTRALPCPVISVGNITVGGSGKTPLTMHIAGFLRDRGVRVVVLSRGYKGSIKDVGVVTDGRKISLGPEVSGDEPYLMARRLKDVPIVVGPDRFTTGMYSIHEFSPDVIVLDDGFQHIRLHRDLNILLVDSKVGFGNGYVLPGGILREPLRGIRRADAAMIKGGALKEEDGEFLESFALPVIRFDYRAQRCTDLKDQKESDPGTLRGKKALIVAGIANPGSFFKTMESLGITAVDALFYPDHHGYTAADFQMIMDKKTSSGAELVVTTEKDGVKLEVFAGGGPAGEVYSLGIDVDIEDTKGFERLLAPFAKGGL